MGSASSRLSRDTPNSWDLFLSPEGEPGQPSPTSSAWVSHVIPPVHLVSSLFLTLKFSIIPSGGLQTVGAAVPRATLLSSVMACGLVATNLGSASGCTARWTQGQEHHAEPGQRWQHLPALQPSLQYTWGHQHRCVEQQGSQALGLSSRSLTSPSSFEVPRRCTPPLTEQTCPSSC